MNINITIERIDNGYIVSGDGVTDGKLYIASLEKFAEAYLVEALREKDKDIKHHNSSGQTFRFSLSTNL